MTRSAWWVYGLLVLASVVYGSCLFADLFGGEQHWGRGDWDQFTFRFATPRTAMLRDGQLPLWNPYVNGGNVLLAHPHCPAFSPWYLLTLALGAPLGLRLGVVLFVALGSTGMAALLRRWKVSPAGCCIGGIVLMMSAHFTMHVTEGHLEWCVLGLMPWVMSCLVRGQETQEEGGWRFVVLGALVLASAWLYGSIYIVAIFVPLLGIWAALESVRTRCWYTVASYTVLICLTALLCAVVLLPRMAFLRANPRKTELHEQVSPAMLGRMLFDPGQAALYRATRDVRNPSADELIRLLPASVLSSAKPYETLKWHRLEITLETTSDWSDVRFGDVPHLWFYDGPDAPDRTPARLSSLPLSGEGLSIRNPKPGDLVSRQATVYLQLPARGNLKFVVNRGYLGASRVTVTRDEEVLLDAIHADAAPGGWDYWRPFFISRAAILAGGPDSGESPAAWYEIDAGLKTTADWCKVEVVNCPYLLKVESPRDEATAEPPYAARLATTSLDVKNRRPGETETVRRAKLYVRVPEDGDVRVAITQSASGTTALTLKSPRGDILETTRTEATEPSGEKTFDYLLSGELIGRRLSKSETSPFRWRLDELGMTYDWHEYGCYVTWLGLATAAVGLVVSFRRQWPLLAAGAVAGLVTMGAVLPLNFWTLWKLLPMYQSLQVPSRFLVAVVFVTAVLCGYGVDRIGRWGQRAGGPWLRRLLECGLVLAVYVELAVLACTLFSQVFVCPKRPVPGVHSKQHDAQHDKQFAQRYAEDDVRYAAMYSAHYPYLLDNSGVLREYENIAVPRGKVRLAGDPDYRGEAFLEGSHGRAEIVEWTMSRVKVAVEADSPDRLVLNQNYFSGWKAIGRDVVGGSRRLRAQPGSGSFEGLVSIAVNVGDREVEFYYVPDGFAVGAVVSGLTLLGCLGALLVGSRRYRNGQTLEWLAARFTACRTAMGRSRTFGHIAAAAVLNCPFLLCHPGWTLIEAPLVRSLAVNLVLFIVPGLPLVGAMIGRRWLTRFGLLCVMIASLGVLMTVLAGAYLAGWAISASLAWNATWVITNLALLLNVAVGGPYCWKVAGSGIRFRGVQGCLAVGLFAVSYFSFFLSATQLVPSMQDHDLDIQGPGYSLLTRFEPMVVTDRNTLYYFAHPLLLNYYEAASFLYFDRMDYLARFDVATQRALLAESGDLVVPAVGEFIRLKDNRLVRDRGEYVFMERGATRHRIVGQRAGDYLVEPPLPKWENLLPVRELEVQILYDDYHHEPRRLETRTPNVFLAALTVALLGCWASRWTGRCWFYSPLPTANRLLHTAHRLLPTAFGLLVALAYLTSPEVLVRSSYGGFYAISAFALMQILLAVERRTSDHSPDAWINAFLAGGFSALANNKLVLLPISLVVWQWLRMEQMDFWKRTAKAIAEPVALGFFLGTVGFCVYGLAVNPAAFWADYVRTHVVDRVIHHNPFNYQGYPTVAGLWLEFWQHTGYLLLPLGIAAMAYLCWTKNASQDACEIDQAGPGWRSTAGLWGIWVLLTAVAFSLIDWRQTKHLMPLMLPLHLAPARWAGKGSGVLVVVGVALAGLLIWNLAALRFLAADFGAFSITPAW